MILVTICYKVVSCNHRNWDSSRLEPSKRGYSTCGALSMLLKQNGSTHPQGGIQCLMRAALVPCTFNFEEKNQSVLKVTWNGSYNAPSRAAWKLLESLKRILQRRIQSVLKELTWKSQCSIKSVLENTWKGRFNVGSRASWKLLEMEMLQRSIKSVLEVTWKGFFHVASVLEVTWKGFYNVGSRAFWKLLEEDVTTLHPESRGSYFKRKLVERVGWKSGKGSYRVLPPTLELIYERNRLLLPPPNPPKHCHLWQQYTTVSPLEGHRDPKGHGTWKSSQVMTLALVCSIFLGVGGNPWGWNASLTTHYGKPNSTHWLWVWSLGHTPVELGKGW